MPVVSKNEAIALLTKEVEENLTADDLLEVHNELFPDDPYTEEEVYDDTTPAIEQLVDYLHGGREAEEIIDLWNLIFPKHRNVWYDEEEQRIHYNEESEPSRTE
jgi:hypothetical protein